MNVTDQLHSLLAKRVLVLDGAMGTMIQRCQLNEADFRGERFRNHACDLKGNNDLLVITRPSTIKKIHDEYFEAGANDAQAFFFGGEPAANTRLHSYFHFNYYEKKGTLKEDQK